MKGNGEVRPSRARVGDALRGADDQVAAGHQGVGEPRVQRVAHLLGEVDDGVAAEDQVVAAPRNGHAQQVADVEAHHPLQLGLACHRAAVGQRLEPALDERAAGHVRASSAENSPRAGALDHAAVEVGAVDLHARVRDGLAGDGGERVGLGAVGASRRSRRGCGGARRARAGRGGQRRDWSPWRHRCETLIVTRSRNASSSSVVAAGARVGRQVAARRGARRRCARGAPSGRACTGGGRRRRSCGRPRRSGRTRRAERGLKPTPAGRGGRAGGDGLGRVHEASRAIAAGRSPSARTSSARPASAMARGMP